MRERKVDDDVVADDDATLDRRALIRKIGVAGAVAWTAPVVMDSVLSPAAAQSAPGGPGGPQPFDAFEDFEGVDAAQTGDYSTWSASGNVTGAPGWQVTVGSVDVILTNGSNYNTNAWSAGNRVLELGGSDNPGVGPAGTVVWTVTIPSAQSLRLAFSWNNPSGNLANVTVDQGAFTRAGPFVLAASTPAVTPFVSPSFAVSPGPLTVTFEGTGTSPSGAIIDNVHLYTG